MFWKPKTPKENPATPPQPAKPPEPPRIDPALARLSQSELDSRLFSACFEEKVRDVEALLRAGADVESVSSLILGRCEDIRIVKLLLEHGASRKADDVLDDVAKRGRADILRLLFEYGADIKACGDRALTEAVHAGHVEAVGVLLEHGANIECDNLLHGRVLAQAATQKKCDMLQFLIDKGADIHADGDYALINATQNGRVESIKLLLAHGADVHAQNDLALRVAAFEGRLDCVDILAAHILRPEAWKTEDAFKAECDRLAQVIRTGSVQTHNLFQLSPTTEQIAPPRAALAIARLETQATLSLQAIRRARSLAQPIRPQPPQPPKPL